MQNENKAEKECVNLFEFDVSLHRVAFSFNFSAKIYIYMNTTHVTSTERTDFILYTYTHAHAYTYRIYARQWYNQKFQIISRINLRFCIVC